MWTRTKRLYFISCTRVKHKEIGMRQTRKRKKIIQIENKKKHNIQTQEDEKLEWNEKEIDLQPYQARILVTTNVIFANTRNDNYRQYWNVANGRAHIDANTREIIQNKWYTFAHWGIRAKICCSANTWTFFL